MDTVSMTCIWKFRSQKSIFNVIYTVVMLCYNSKRTYMSEYMIDYAYLRFIDMHVQFLEIKYQPKQCQSLTVFSSSGVFPASVTSCSSFAFPPPVVFTSSILHDASFLVIPVWAGFCPSWRRQDFRRIHSDRRLTPATTKPKTRTTNGGHMSLMRRAAAATEMSLEHGLWTNDSKYFLFR